MKRWILGAVLAAVLALLVALPAWAEEVYAPREVAMESEDLAFAEAELEVYMSGAKPISNGALVDAGNLKLLVMPTAPVAGESVRVYAVAPGAKQIKIIVNGSEWMPRDGDKYNTFLYQSKGEATISASALIDGAWTEPCEPVIAMWTVLGELEAPQIALPQSGLTHEPIEISWTPVANAQEYSWRVYRNDGGGYQSISGYADKDTTSASMVLSVPGTYTASVSARTRGYVDGEGYAETQFVVEEATPTTNPLVQLTADRTEIFSSQGVELCVTAEGADAYQIYPTYFIENQESTQIVWPYEDTTYVAYARVNGQWIGPSAPLTVKVSSYGTLRAPQISAPLVVEANVPFTISWSSVEHAEGYRWSVGGIGGTTSADVTSVEVMLEEEGLYTVDVEPYAEGWGIRGEMARILVAGQKMQDTSVRLSAPATVQAHSRVFMTVTAEGAEAYRVYRLPGQMVAESTSSTLSVKCDQPGKYAAYAKINGEWQGPSEPVTVLLTPDAVLPSALKEIKAEAFVGADFTVVQCPQGMTRIGAKAFANCPNLVQVTVPSSVTAIADNAFAGSGSVTLCGAEGSYAQQWAQAHGVPWVTKP